LVAELDPTGSHLLFSTTIGSHGLNTASPAGLAVDTSGDIFLAGNNDGPDLFTTPGAFQTTSGDGVCCQKGNGFVAKISPTNPQITAVTDAAGYQQGISPGAWIVIWGANLSIDHAIVADERNHQRQAAHPVGWSRRDRGRQAGGGLLHQPRPT